MTTARQIERESEEFQDYRQAGTVGTRGMQNKHCNATEAYCQNTRGYSNELKWLLRWKKTLCATVWGPELTIKQCKQRREGRSEGERERDQKESANDQETSVSKQKWVSAFCWVLHGWRESDSLVRKHHALPTKWVWGTQLVQSFSRSLPISLTQPRPFLKLNSPWSLLWLQKVMHAYSLATQTYNTNDRVSDTVCHVTAPKCRIFVWQRGLVYTTAIGPWLRCLIY